jgi:predicted nucleotidyltransferase
VFLVWKEKSLEEVLNFFKKEDGVNVLILIGSFANEGAKTDEWSDLDFVIICEDEVINGFIDCTDWLDAFGTIFAIERNKLGNGRVLRVCFEDFKRLDFLFIPFAAFGESFSWKDNPFRDGYKVLFSQIAGLESLIDKIQIGKPDEE